MSTNRGSKVFLDFDSAGVKLGRVVLDLYNDLAPLSTLNFINLCSGIKIEDKFYSYKHSLINKVIKNFIVQGGDLNGNISTVYGSQITKPIPGENLVNDFEEPFKLCLANNGDKDINGSQFFITTYTQPHLSGKNSVIGHVLHGKSVIREIEKISTNNENVPLTDVKIVDCGVWEEGMEIPIYNASYNQIGGDIYEEYPDDDKNIDHDSSESVYNAANIIKESGTLLLKQGNKQEAYLKYVKCLRYIMEFIPDQDQEPDWFGKYSELKKKIYLNLGLVCLQLQNYKKSIDFSSYLLDLTNVTIQDRAKALFRRGKSYIELKKFDLAIDDLKLASELLPNDESIKTNLIKAEKLQKTAKEMEKVKYSKFFG